MTQPQEKRKWGNGFKDMTGERFGKLVAVAPVKRPGQKTRWECKCDCGEVTFPYRHSLVQGDSMSCGCANRGQNLVALNSRHGGANRRTGRQPRLYRTWCGMKARCENPKAGMFDNYGGRGIKVCDRWQDFANFQADMGAGMAPGLSIDRIDNNGPYSPENCRWIPFALQARNTRTNRNVTFQGKTQCVAAWAEELGVSASMIHGRLSKGWSVADALTKPSRRGPGQHGAFHADPHNRQAHA